MALVGSISGSLVAITGSVSPGADNLYSLGGSSSKWLNVVATSITGSLTRLASGVEYLKPGSNITLTTGSDGSVTIAASGGGGGAGVFTEASSTAAYTTSSIAVGFSAAASSKGTAVFFAVSGSDANVNTALFSGPVVSSGSFSVKSAGTTVGTIDSSGVVSGSALQTVGNLSVQGTSALVGDVTVTGDVAVNGGDLTTTATGTATLFNTTATTVNIAGGATAGTNIGNVSGLTTIAGGVKVSGNFISGSASKNLTLGSNGDVTVEGDLTVTGNDIVFSAGTGNIATAATTLTVGSSAGRVVIPGDLEVQGTTMTVSASNLVIEDPLVGFGFLTGSTPGSSTGDRGFIGGYLGTGNNVAFGYSLTNTAFVATKTTDDATSTTFTVSDLQPIRASKFQVSGSTAEIKGNGSTLQLSGTQLDVFAGANGVTLYRDGSNYGDLTGQTTGYGSTGGLRLEANGGNAVAISGSAVWLNGDGGQVYVGRNDSGVPSSGFLVSVNPGTAPSGAGGSVQLVAKRGDGASAPSLPMTLTGSSLNFSVANALTGISIQDVGVEFATITRVGGTAARLLGTSGLVLSGTAVSLQTQTDNITLRTAAIAQGVNYNVGATTYANISSGSYAGGGTDAITLTNAAKLTATTDLALSAGGAGSIVASGSNSLHLNFGQAINFQNAGTGYLQVLSSSYTSTGGTAGNIVKLEGRNANGIVLIPASGKKVHLSGSIELGGGVDNTINFLGYVNSSILPSADVSFTLGSPTARWQHIYTGDLHLRNDRGDYTLIEETDFLSIRFNKNGKRYKFLLERVPELDEPAR